MSFSQRYEDLERKFCERVQKDFDDYCLENVMLRNIQPDGLVDFILIAQEPAGGYTLTGARPPDWECVKDKENRNFCGQKNDFMFQYCVRNYLCEENQTYYLTDLSKGAMPPKQAKDTSVETHKRWYPLLVEELNLVAKPERTRIIAIGKTKVHKFLRRRKEFEGIEWVIHYSRAAIGARSKAIEPWLDEFPEFAKTLKFEDILDTTEKVLCRAGYSKESRQKKHQELWKGSRLTDGDKKFVFYYKKRFEELKDSKGLIWKGES